MAPKFPQFLPTNYLNRNWDTVDPIHVNHAIILWSNVNPFDNEAINSAANNIQKTTDLFLKGREKGDLNFPLEKRKDNRYIPGEDEFYLSRIELQSFAKKVRQKPLFLFPKTGRKKKYNIPPKPEETAIDPPQPDNWSNPNFCFPGDTDTPGGDEWQIWSVDVFFWMLFGDPFLDTVDHPRRMGNLSKISTPRKNKIKEIYGQFEKSLKSGRFGRFTDKDEPALLFFNIHPLRIIDWLEEVNLLPELESYGFGINPNLKKLFEKWNAQKDHVEGPSHDLNFEKLAKKDVWARHELQLILLEEFYSQSYPATQYHKFNPALEQLKHQVDQEINQAMAGKRIAIPNLEMNFGGERTTPGFLAQELLIELKRLEYPVPKGLIEAREQGDWATAEKLLHKLHENMKEIVLSGGKATNLNWSENEKRSPHPGTYPAKMKALHDAYVKLATQKLSSYSHLNATALLEDLDLKSLIRESGLSQEERPKLSTLKVKWIPEANKNSSNPRKSGRPRKS